MLEAEVYGGNPCTRGMKESILLAVFCTLLVFAAMSETQEHILGR
jgi:hypothetical protein